MKRSSFIEEVSGVHTYLFLDADGLKMASSHFFFLIFKVVEVVINKEYEEVLTAEMAKIKVDFKRFDDFNQLAEKCERK